MSLTKYRDDSTDQVMAVALVLLLVHLNIQTRAAISLLTYLMYHVYHITLGSRLEQIRSLLKLLRKLWRKANPERPIQKNQSGY